MVKKTPASKKPSSGETGVKATFLLGPRSLKRLRETSSRTGMSQSRLIDGLIQRCLGELEDELERAMKGK